MQANFALNEALRSRFFPNSKLAGQANLLVMPTLDAANIAFNMAMMLGEGLHVGPILIGAAASAHILTPSVTARGITNMSAFAVVDALCAYEGVPSDWRNPIHPQADAPVLTVTFEKDGQRSSWFSTIATIGTAQDVTLQEFRIESFFPADEETEAFARRLAAAAAN